MSTSLLHPMITGHLSWISLGTRSRILWVWPLKGPVEALPPAEFRSMEERVKRKKKGRNTKHKNKKQNKEQVEYEYSHSHPNEVRSYKMRRHRGTYKAYDVLRASMHSHTDQHNLSHHLSGFPSIVHSLLLYLSLILSISSNISIHYFIPSLKDFYS